MLRAWPDRLVTGSGTAERRKWVMSRDSSRRDYFSHWLVTVHPAHICVCVWLDTDREGRQIMKQTTTQREKHREREKERDREEDTEIW